jgi:hypothetical protein
MINTNFMTTDKGIFPQRKACAEPSEANRVTGKKCIAFFTARGAQLAESFERSEKNSPYWMGLGENSRRR